MIHIAICDDEKEEQDSLYGFVRQCLTGYTERYQVELFGSGEELLDSGFIPDILFLDIIMDGKDGIQTGAEIRKRSLDVIIIYITNLGEKITEAVNGIHSYGYLLKPVDGVQLSRMIQEAVGMIRSRKMSCYESFLSDKNIGFRMLVNEIYYFEYRSRRIKVVTKEGPDIYIRETISSVAERMEKYGFAMSHQSFVVNLYEVDAVCGSMLKMKNGDMVYLAQKRASDIKDRMMQLGRRSILKGDKRI